MSGEADGAHAAVEVKKRIRMLQKKIRQAIELRQMRASGKELNLQQQQKLIHLPALEEELHALLQCAAAVIDGAARLDDDWVMCRALAAGPDFNARLAHVRPARVPAKRVKAVRARLAALARAAPGGELDVEALRRKSPLASELLAWLQHLVLIHDVLAGDEPLQPPRRAPNAPPPPHQAHRIGAKVALGAPPTV